MNPTTIQMVQDVHRVRLLENGLQNLRNAELALTDERDYGIPVLEDGELAGLIEQLDGMQRKYADRRNEVLKRLLNNIEEHWPSGTLSPNERYERVNPETARVIREEARWLSQTIGWRDHKGERVTE